MSSSDDALYPSKNGVSIFAFCGIVENGISIALWLVDTNDTSPMSAFFTIFMILLFKSLKRPLKINYINKELQWNEQIRLLLFYYISQK